MEIDNSINKNILNSIIKRDNAILLYDYDRIIGKTIIYFKCQCGKEYNKCFGFLKKNMFATCKECSKQNGIKKIVNKIHKSDNYKEKLNLALKRDNAKLIGDYNRIHPYSRITYMCNCTEEYSKVLRVILSKGGAFCKECSRENKSKKIKEVLSNSELINDKKNNF